MKYLILTLAAVVQLVFCTSPIVAQSPSNQIQSNAPVVLARTSTRQIGFRLTEWKTIHAQSVGQADQEVAALKKIGCEVTSNDHGGHVDIKYRCPQWKSMKVPTETLAKQWSSWCTAKGMETVEMNPPANTKYPTVEYRLPVPQTVHLHNSDQATQIITTLKLIGCQVSTNDHGNHLDTTFSCPQWSTIALPSEESAHSWQSWLDESGFETRHQH